MSRRSSTASISPRADFSSQTWLQAEQLARHTFDDLDQRLMSVEAQYGQTAAVRGSGSTALGLMLRS